MDDVNKEVLRAIGEGRTIRIVVDIPTNVLDPVDYLTSATNTIKPLMTE